MRLFTACLGTETNTFSPIPTGLPAFQQTMLCHGDGSRNGRHPMVEPVRLWRSLAEAQGHEVVESLSAFAEPGGLTTAGAHQTLRNEILRDLETALPVDLVLLSLHGAMAADGCLDVEGDLLERVRKAVGPKVMVGVELDLHCQMTDAMLANADVIVIFKEYPHVDIVDRARELYAICTQAVASGRKPVMTFQRCGINAYMPTTNEPMRSFVQRLKEAEGKEGVLSVSLAHGFPHGDVPGVGAGVLVVSEQESAAAATLARSLAEELWSQREQLRPPYVSIDEAIDQALACASSPVVIADTSDNAGCGAPSDSTFFLRRLIERGVKDAVSAVYWDPLAVQLCEEAGESARLQLRLGGKCGPGSGDPLDLNVEVVRILPDAVQSFCGFTVPMGTLVWLRTEGIDILVNDKRFQVGAPDLMSNIGIDPRQRRMLVVKSTQHFHFGFAPIASKIIYCAGPGVTNPDAGHIHYTHARRPEWPPEIATTTGKDRPMTSNASLEQRIAALEAIEAIRRLKARYAFYADGKYTDQHQRKPDAELREVARLQASCFTEDAEWDAGQWGVLRGRAALEENFATKPWRFAMHHFVNPIIEVEGDRAKGTWTMWMIGTVASTGESLHLSGYTHDEYRRVNGEWFFSRVRVVDKFLSRFDQPWTSADGPTFYKFG